MYQQPLSHSKGINKAPVLSMHVGNTRKRCCVVLGNMGEMDARGATFLKSEFIQTNLSELFKYVWFIRTPCLRQLLGISGNIYECCACITK